MKASLVCITLAVVIAIVSARNNTKWEEYKKKHGKKYHSPQDEETRRKHFEANDNDISIHNAKFEQGEVSYKTSHNHLSDLAPEHRAVLNGAINVPAIPSHETHGISKRSIGTTCYRFTSNTTRPCMYNYTLDASVVRPATIDLRTSGWTEPVRDQGQCGSCWAFSSSSVDSYYQFSKNKTNVVLSPQNLVDCDGTYGSNGCGGGSAPLAFQYFVQQHQNLESSYPYKGVQSACSRPTTTNLYAVQGLVQISMNWPSQAALEQALYKLGAISISVDANGLFYYSSGIFDGSYVENGVSKTCTTNVNHAVTLVGYGTGYWIIKNSWGPNWGESGYFRMTKSSNNVCGIYNYAYGVY